MPIKKKKLRLSLIGMFLLLLVAQSSNSIAITKIQIDDSNIIGSNTNNLFGYNLHWYNFQYGYLNEQGTSRVVIDSLNKINNAIYRYPGGTVSSFFDWEACRHGGEIKYKTGLNKTTKCLFNLKRYFKFIRSVKGIPHYVLNLTQFSGNIELDKKLISDLKNFLAYFNQLISEFTPDEYCIETTCYKAIIELGNELDHKEYRWNANRYINVVDSVVNIIKAKPNNFFTIAHLETSPWNEKKTRTFNNATLAKKLNKLVDGLAVHIYYDGIKISKTEQILDTIFDQFSERKDWPILITEHARWPKKPLFGSWKTTWYQTGDFSGSLSTAEFLIMLSSKPYISGANWHALGAMGPWQLFSKEDKWKKAKPNTVFYAMKFLKKAMLAQQISIHVEKKGGLRRGKLSPKGLRFAATLNKNKQLNLILLNRSSKKQTIKFSFAESKYQPTHTNIYNIDNINGTPYTNPEDASISIPKKSIVSINFKNLPPTNTQKLTAKQKE